MSHSRELQSITREIMYLDERNCKKEHKGRAVPLNQMTPLMRQKYHNILNGMSSVIAENTVRPTGDALRELRRLEQSMHHTTSASSISLYKTKTANPHYSNQDPVDWESKDAKKTALVFGDTDDTKHAHSFECTLLLDSRFSCGAPLDLPLPRRAYTHFMFPYAGLSPNLKEALQRTNDHTCFVDLLESMNRDISFSKGKALSVLLDDIEKMSSLPLSSVVFRYDNCIELSFNMDTAGTLFGILSLKVCHLGRYDADKQLDVLIRRCTKEISGARKLDEAESNKPSATIGLLDSTSVDALLSKMHRDRALERNYYRPHLEIANGNGSTKSDRLLARSMKLSVFTPEKSPTLMAVQVSYRYGYFAMCQCMIEDDDLFRYKLTYGEKESRFPSYESDGDDYVHDDVVKPDKVVLSAEDKKRIQKDRHTSKKRQKLEYSSTASGLLNEANVETSVPFRK